MPFLFDASASITLICGDCVIVQLNSPRQLATFLHASRPRVGSHYLPNVRLGYAELPGDQGRLDPCLEGCPNGIDLPACQ
jgi:hypothetical protein